MFGLVTLMEAFRALLLLVESNSRGGSSEYTKLKDLRFISGDSILLPKPSIGVVALMISRASSTKLSSNFCDKRAFSYLLTLVIVFLLN